MARPSPSLATLRAPIVFGREHSIPRGVFPIDRVHHSDDRGDEVSFGDRPRPSLPWSNLPQQLDGLPVPRGLGDGREDVPCRRNLSRARGGQVVKLRGARQWGKEPDVIVDVLVSDLGCQTQDERLGTRSLMDGQEHPDVESRQLGETGRGTDQKQPDLRDPTRQPVALGELRLADKRDKGCVLRPRWEPTALPRSRNQVKRPQPTIVPGVFVVLPDEGLTLQLSLGWVEIDRLPGVRAAS